MHHPDRIQKSKVNLKGIKLWIDHKNPTKFWFNFCSRKENGVYRKDYVQENAYNSKSYDTWKKSWDSYWRKICVLSTTIITITTVISWNILSHAKPTQVAGFPVPKIWHSLTPIQGSLGKSLSSGLFSESQMYLLAMAQLALSKGKGSETCKVKLNFVGIAPPFSASTQSFTAGLTPCASRMPLKDGESGNLWNDLKASWRKFRKIYIWHFFSLWCNFSLFDIISYAKLQHSSIRLPGIAK